MVIHCLNTAEKCDQERLSEILKIGTDDQKLIDEAISIIKKTDSIKYSQEKAQEIIEKAWNNVTDCIPNNKYKGYLKALTSFFVSRNV